jgi:hypothetical protein
LNEDINDNDKNQKLGYAFLLELQPNIELLLIGFPSATLAQNALLEAGLFTSSSLFYF